MVDDSKLNRGKKYESILLKASGQRTTAYATITKNDEVADDLL